MKPHEQAGLLRQHFGREGWTVYDRKDRWVQEHKHEHSDRRIEGCITLEFCHGTKAVLVAWEDGWSGSRCGRCSAHISTVDIQQYIKAGYLCVMCSPVTDSEHGQKQVEDERSGRPSGPDTSRIQ